jgi:hypothetical protein
MSSFFLQIKKNINIIFFDKKTKGINGTMEPRNTAKQNPKTKTYKPQRRATQLK